MDSTPETGAVPVEIDETVAPDDVHDVANDDFCRTYLAAHGVSLEYARACGLKSAPDRWNKEKGRPIVGGLLIPYHPGLWRLRRRRTHIPAQEEGGNVVVAGYDVPKFTSTPGADIAPYCPPTGMPEHWATETSCDIFIAEGPIKALCLTERGLPCIGMGGVEAGFHDVATKREEGVLELHPRLRSLAWTGRRVFIAYDAFRCRNPDVARGEARLACLLGRHGAVVFLIELPTDSRMGRDVAAYLDDERDQGPDDFVVRKGVEAFRALVASAVHADPVERIRACCDGDQARRLLDDLPFQAAVCVRGASAVAAAVSAFRRTHKLDIGKSAINAKVDEYRRRVSTKAASERSSGGTVISAHTYEIRGGNTCLVIETDAGRQYQQVANFSATITREVAQDDGVASSTLFTVAGQLATGIPLPTIEVPAANWNDRSWVAQRWGSRAVVEAGRDSWSHLLAATQKASTPSTTITYLHTGWRKLGDRTVFLVPGRSVGRDDAIEVRDPDDRGRYGFPADAGSNDDTREAVRRSLALIAVGDPSVTVPVLSAAYTAPLASILEVDFAVWASGSSGAYKSSLAGLVQSHFGHFTYNSLPMSWSSTPNAIEALLYRAKDVLTVVDNYVPGLDRDGVAKVNRIVQQIGDRGSRGRLTKSSDPMASRPPRGLMLATGEDVPVGTSDSTVGRLVVVRIKSGDVAKADAIAASRYGESYGRAMHAYIEWIAADYERFARTIRQNRDTMASEGFPAALEGHGVHPRTERSVATLAAGFMAFLRFAVDTEAISADEYTDLRAVAARAFAHVARDQASLREDARPVDRYVATLRALLLQGRATLAERFADLDDHGIGWEDDDYVYLEADLTWKAIEDFHSQSAHKWPYSKVQMHRALIDTGIVHRGESDKATAKRALGASREPQRVLLVPRSHLASAIPARVTYGADSDDDVGM